jgi:PLP dependent protein
MTEGIPGRRVAEDLRTVLARINAAATKADRDPSEVTLVAVSKAHPVEKIQEALEAEHLDFGENYVQEFRDKAAVIDDPEVRWHYIGRLQGNKVKQLIGHVHTIHSVDRLRIAKEVGKRSAAAGLSTRVLIQINVGREESKGGLSPEKAEDDLGRICEIDGIDVAGLTAIPPFLDDPEKVRPYFVKLRELRDRLQSSLGHPLPELSMGMSSDYEVAIAEGATLVRVGTAIFGARRY